MVTAIPDYRLKIRDVVGHMPADVRWELRRGELIIMSPAGYNHGLITMRLAARLYNFVDSEKLGTVFGAETGFLLPKLAESLLAPDVAFVRAGRLPQVNGPGYFAGPPDLAVEVISPSESQEAARAKAYDWIEAGTREIWNVWPSLEAVTIYRPDADPVTFDRSQVLRGSSVLSGFTCSIAEIFEY